MLRSNHTNYAIEEDLRALFEPKLTNYCALCIAAKIVHGLPCSSEPAEVSLNVFSVSFAE